MGGLGAGLGVVPGTWKKKKTTGHPDARSEEGLAGRASLRFGWSVSLNKGPVIVSTLPTFITSPLSFYGAQGMKTRCAICGQRFGEGSAAAGGRGVTKYV